MSGRDNRTTEREFFGGLLPDGRAIHEAVMSQVQVTYVTRDVPPMIPGIVLATTVIELPARSGRGVAMPSLLRYLLPRLLVTSSPPIGKEVEL